MVLILSVVWKSWKDYTSLIQYFLVLQVDTMLVDSSAFAVALTKNITSDMV